MKPEMIAHWRNLAKYDGKHLPVLDAACVPQVWVIDGKFPSNLREKIVAHVIPLKIGGWNLWARRKAAQERDLFAINHGGSVCMLMISHEDTETGWFVRYVLIDDFQKTTAQIAAEMSQALKDGNVEVAEMKECIWLAMMGLTDPE